jgi:glycosyltransferase involved in cell wall biosynthesis
MPQKRLKVLIVGPLPPPHNGMSTMTVLALQAVANEPRIHGRHLDTSDHRTVSNVGRLEMTNAIAALGAWRRFVWQLVVFRPAMVYVPIAKNRLGFLRDSAFLLLARVTHTTIVIHFHAEGFRRFYTREASWMQFLIRSCLKGGGLRVIVLSPELKSDFHQFVPDALVKVVPNGIPDTRPVAFEADAHPRPVLYLSTLESPKGVFDALRAAEIVLRQLPEQEFIFAGPWYSGAEQKRAEEFVRERGLEASVRFIGPVDGERKWELYSGANVFILPSHSEGQPVVILEAMCFGVPVITTRVGALPATIAHGVSGYLIDVSDVESLAAYITRICSDPELRARMGMRARERYERDYTSSRFSRRLTDVLIWAARPSGSPNAAADVRTGTIP